MKVSSVVLYGPWAWQQIAFIYLAMFKFEVNIICWNSGSIPCDIGDDWRWRRLTIIMMRRQKMRNMKLKTFSARIEIRNIIFFFLSKKRTKRTPECPHNSTDVHHIAFFSKNIMSEYTLQSSSSLELSIEKNSFVLAFSGFGRIRIHVNEHWTQNRAQLEAINDLPSLIQQPFNHHRNCLNKPNKKCNRVQRSAVTPQSFSSQRNRIVAIPFGIRIMCQ